jgi:hypothetical protein
LIISGSTGSANWDKLNLLSRFFSNPGNLFFQPADPGGNPHFTGFFLQGTLPPALLFRLDDATFQVPV